MAGPRADRRRRHRGARRGGPPRPPEATGILTRPAVELAAVTVTEHGHDLIAGVDLTIAPRSHVAVLGPNGAGKTTLLRVLAGYRHPTSGEARILGERLGAVDVRGLRRRIGFVSTALHPLLQTSATAAVVVAAARHGATAHVRGLDRDDAARAAALAALARVGAGHLAERRCSSLSQGEWQRVQIARCLVAGAELLLLDEPMAGLDIGGRERMISDLAQVMDDPEGPTVVLVTHHVEEIPPATPKAVLLADGRIVAAGPIEEVLTTPRMTATFGVPIEVARADGRWAGRLRDPGLE